MLRCLLIVAAALSGMAPGFTFFLCLNLACALLFCSTFRSLLAPRCLSPSCTVSSSISAAAHPASANATLGRDLSKAAVPSDWDASFSQALRYVS